MRHLLLPILLATPLFVLSGCGEKITEQHLSRAEIAGAEAVMGQTMTAAEVALMQDDLLEQRGTYQRSHAHLPPNSLRPAVRFDPELLTGPTAGISDQFSLLGGPPSQFSPVTKVLGERPRPECAAMAEASVAAGLSGCPGLLCSSTALLIATGAVAGVEKGHGDAQ